MDPSRPSSLAADGSCGKHREFLVGWANRLLTNVERWFADREFVATKDFTVADILMSHVLSVIMERAVDRAVWAHRLVSGSVLGSTGVEADHGRVPERGAPEQSAVGRTVAALPFRRDLFRHRRDEPQRERRGRTGTPPPSFAFLLFLRQM
jgi:glutathione S-transferase